MNNIQNTAPIEGATAQIVGVSVPVTKKIRNTRVKKQEPVVTPVADETTRLMADVATYYANAHSYGFGDVKYSMIPIHLLKIDKGYQRTLSQKHVDDLVENWVNNQCDHVVVNFRDDGKSVGFYVIDGQHRIAAAIQTGIPFLPCKIYHRLTYQQEARMFVEQGAKQMAVNTFAKFHALCEAGDEKALILNALCQKYNVATVRKPAGTPGQLNGMGTLLRIMDNQGGGVVTEIFETIKECGWHSSRSGYRSAILLALRNVYCESVVPAGRMQRIVEKVGSKSPILTLYEAQVDYPELAPSDALTKYFAV